MQATSIIDGTPTDFVISVYANRVFVIITQNGKPGTLVHVSRDQGAGGAGGRSLNSRILIGKREDYISVYAKKIGELIAARTNKPLLLALCLLKENPEVFRSIVQASVLFLNSLVASLCTAGIPNDSLNLPWSF